MLTERRSAGFKSGVSSTTEFFCLPDTVDPRGPKSVTMTRRRCDTSARPASVMDVPANIVRLAAYTVRGC